MRLSARSVERRGGFTLLEVLIASSLLSTLMFLAASQVGESTDVAKFASAQADLRRAGEDLMGRIEGDIRSTQARFAAVPPSADRIELYKVTGFDPSTSPGSPLLEQQGGAIVIHQYWWQPPATLATAADYKTGTLYLQIGTSSAPLAAASLPLSTELDPQNGFSIVAAAQDGAPLTLGALGLGLTGNPSIDAPFADKPTIVWVKLVLSRRLGRHFHATGAADNWVATVTVESKLTLRGSQSY